MRKNWMTLALLAGTATSGAYAGDSGEVAFWLTVLHNNDGESQLIDAGADLPDFGGVARFATVVDNLRAAAPTAPAGGSLLISAGDNYLAGPEFNASLNNGIPFYDTLALELVGYDVAAIGNHEFDFGPDVLADFLAGFVNGPTFVSSNLDFSNEPGVQTFVDNGLVARSAVFTVDGVQVGVVGATTPTLPFVSSPRDTIINDVAMSVQAEIDALEASGVNIILLSSHLQDVDEEIMLVNQLSGIDAVIAGGGDELLANPGDLLIPGDSIDRPYPEISISMDGADVPVVVTPGDYTYVGRLVLGFDADGNLVEIDSISGPVRVAGGANPDAVEPDSQVQAQVVDPVVAALDAQASNIVYSTNVGLNGIRPNIRRVETNLGNLIADSFLWNANQLAPSFGLDPVDVALANGGGIRNDSIIPGGDVSELENFGVLPFGNFLSVVPSVPASQFKEIMENAVSQVENTAGRYAQISGFTMVFDLNETAQVLDDNGNVTTAGSRIRELVLADGTIIVSNGVLEPGAPSINVAIVDFLARGGDQYPFRGASFTTLGITYDRALSEYVQSELGGFVDVRAYPGGGENRVVAIDGPDAIGYCLSDVNLDLQRNFFDVSYFIEFYVAGSPAADYNQDGTLNAFDVTEFIMAFDATCSDG
ncbi:MAG: 5'-nucleotidase C-terminal domain-containing protein [Phycisphaerales bacterium]